MPQALRNKLRWSPDRYAQLEATLSAGDVLRLDVTNGKAVWRTVSGEAVRRDTVERLLGVGVLALPLTFDRPGPVSQRNRGSALTGCVWTGTRSRK